jgi:hypothetical protein
VNRRRHWEWWCNKERGRKLLLVRELGLDEAGQVRYLTLVVPLHFC